MEKLLASCLCGGVRFELPAQFEHAGFCHCTTCKKISGGVGTASALVPTDAIRIISGADLLRTYRPAEGSAKTFCATCGSNLFGANWPDSEHATVRLPAIDSAFVGRPQSHGFTRSVGPWETLPDDGLLRK